MIRSTVLGFVAGALCALALSPVASAQVAPGSPEVDGAVSPKLDAFFARHGDGWKVAQDVVANRPTFVWGQRIAHEGATPRTAIEFEVAARSAVDTNFDVFGFDSTELQLSEVRFLDLARAGTSDKVAVVFDQVVDGIAVVAGSVTVLFERKTGDVIALDTTGIPGAGAVELIPTGTLDAATASAYAAYEAKFGVPALAVDDVEMGVMGSSIIWDAKSPIQERAPALVYVLSISSPGFMSNEGVPAQARVYVSAEGDSTVFHVEATAHAAITGNVTGHTNTGGETNTTVNQETVNLPFMHVRMNSAGGSILATTDVDGNFTMAQNGPINLFFELRGPWVNVNNGQGADTSFIVNSSSAAPVNVLFNPTNTEFPSGEMAAFHWVNHFRQWVKGVSPSDLTMDFQVVADVNQNVVAGITNCNAVYVGNAIQFLKAGSCQNTSYRPVILHEEGHWANEKYNGGNGMSGAFHEGNGDAWAYTITDSPCLNSFSGGGCLRSALQTSIKKCSTDGSETCNGGEGHDEGQAIASAIWKVRDNLNISLGDASGDAVHDLLFLSWMQSFNDKVILNVIQDHWLALDDDDADLDNGSPHFQEITTGFHAYNWPLISLPDLAFTSVVGPAANASLSPFQGSQIKATITSILGSVASAEVRYSVNNGAFTNLPMAPTANPSEWSALIPGQANQSTVRWYIHAVGTASGSVLDSPSAGAEGPNVYFHGVYVQFAFFNFENLTSDEGWTHVNLSGSNGDQWQRNDPAASEESTDAHVAFSGSRIWGTDLSATGTDGQYEQNSSGELRSPMFNFSSTPKVILQFRRWLAVEKSNNGDQAAIFVNNTQIFSNPTLTNLIDTSWQLAEFDISAQAANNPAVQIKFRLTADPAAQFGGWNIDDVLLYRIDPAPSAFFSAYGAGCPGTGGLVPSLQGAGVPASGNAITINVTNGLANTTGTLLLSTTQGSTSLGDGCTLLLGTPIFPSAITLPLNGSGAISLPALLPPGLPPLDLFMQVFPADPGSANGSYSATNGLQCTSNENSEAVK